jgi:lipase
MRGGARPVLALHCSFAHAGAWAALAAQMHGVTLTAIDQPGHGRAADWDGQGDLHGLYTDWAVQMAEHLGAGQPIDIFGHSYGATVALRLAMQRPDLVRSLVLVEPSLFAAAKGTAVHAEFTEVHRPLHALLAAGDCKAAAELFHGLWGAGEALADLPVALRSYILERIPLLITKDPYLAEDRAGLLQPGRLEAIRVPVLLVGGQDSPAVAGAVTEALAARLPQAQRLEVAGARHMVPITHAAAMGPAVQAHLDGA